MATEDLRGTLPTTFVASATLVTKQYYIVKRHTVEGQIAICSNAGDLPLGIVRNAPAAGGEAAILTVGSNVTAKVVSDGTTPIAIGDTVGTDAAGKAIKKTADAAYIIGIALQASAADGIVIEVDLSAGGQRAS